MAVGLPLKTTYANGDVYSASDVNDTNGTVNLFQTSTLSYQAGKNAIINGGMDIWQRGTSIAVSASSNPYTCDRWKLSLGSGATYTVSRQVTGDTTNLPSIQYAARVQRNSGQTGVNIPYFIQGIETVNSIPYAGKTVTVSFYARKGSNFSAASDILTLAVAQGTGTDQDPAGAYTGQNSFITTNFTLTSTWQRFSATGTVGSTTTEIKAITHFTPVGTASTNDYYEITGVQMELGSYATTFSRAGGTIQGELAACQRYYWRQTADATAIYALLGNGPAVASNTVAAAFVNPVAMRTIASSVDFSTLQVNDGATITAVTGVTLAAIRSSYRISSLDLSTSGGLTTTRFYVVGVNNSSTGFIGFSAEL